MRELLGGRGPTGELLIGRTYASALKQAAGMAGTRLFDVDAAVKWRKEHPAWKMTEVYPRSPSCSRTGQRVAVAGKSGEPS